MRPHSVVVDSPLESGETETMRVIMRYMDKVTKSVTRPL